MVTGKLGKELNLPKNICLVLKRLYMGRDRHSIKYCVIIEINNLLIFHIYHKIKRKEGMIKHTFHLKH